jgi:hypothetical protein
MSKFPLPAPVFVLIWLGLTILLLCGIVAWTISKSSCRNKVPAPHRKILFLIAFLQILVGSITTAILQASAFDPYRGIGFGIGMAILAGIPLQKGVLKTAWKQTFKIWGLGALIQLVLLPICIVVSLIMFAIVSIWLYPPIF